MNFPIVCVSRKRAHDKPWITSGLKRSIKIYIDVDLKNVLKES